MKKTLLLSLAATCAASTALATTLTPEQALARLNAEGPKRISSAARKSEMKLESTVGNLYVFTGKEGYVVLPSDDAAPALLAYSDEGYIKENPGVKFWMEYYNNQIDYLKKHPEAASATGRIEREHREPISPLLKTRWNQEYPYNLLCPKVDGRETVTGCVATAMAQVMKHHSFPEHGKGKHSYFWRPGEEELTFNYDSIPFKWDMMDDVYDKESSETARKAVAELMLGCGVSVDMHYDVGDSGAATTAMGASLIDIFGYSRSLWMPNRAYYGYDEWEEMIYSDLKEGLPVLYSGAGTDGGHQFVCDGYKDDGFFHFNWGWGGLSDGYFLLTALNPDDLGVGGGAGGFNTAQVASLGVRPNKEGDKPVYLFYNTNSFYSTIKEVKEGDLFMCGGQYFNYSLSTMPADSRLGLKFTSEETGEVIYAEGPNVEGYHPDDGRNDLQVRFPKLPDGTYEIIPALHADGEWTKVRIPVGQPQMIIAVVKDGTATIEGLKPASVFVTDIDVPSVIYRGHEFPMTFTVENIGDGEFYSKITPVLLDAKGDVVSKSTFRPVDVQMGEKEDVSDYIGKFTEMKDHSFAPGTYTMVFRDEAGRNVSDPVDVNVQVNNEKNVFKVTDFRLDEKNPVADPESIKFVCKLECQSGVYFGTLKVSVFPGAGGYEIYSKRSAHVYATAGETKGVIIDADMSEFKDGEYQATIYNGAEDMTGYIYFRIDRSETGVDSVEYGITGGLIYDINGIRQTDKSSPGIYIEQGKKILKK